MAASNFPGRGFAPLPTGSRDLLPDACRRREQLLHTLVTTFDRWGYEPVQTPAVEYFDVLGRGLAPSERERCVRFIESGSGEVVSLRPDVTPQIARMVAQRGGHRVDEGKVLRLRYAADVIRIPRARHDHPEVHQLGVELVGDAHPTADAELLVMCHEALAAIGLNGAQFDVTHAGVGRALFAQAGLDPTDEDGLRAAIERKDAVAVEHMLTTLGVEKNLADAFKSICELYGPPEVVVRAREILPASTHRALHDLGQTLQAVASQAPACHARLSVDLGELRGFDYYTGMRLRVWAPKVPGPVVRGGRYDTLLRHYGHDCPASGFAIDLDQLDAACDQQVEQLRPHGVMVTVPREAEALRTPAQSQARSLRDVGVRAWVQVVTDLDHAQRLADTMKIGEVCHLSPGQPATCSHYVRGALGWVRSKSERL